jgi:hypothetical protein
MHLGSFGRSNEYHQLSDGSAKAWHDISRAAKSQRRSAGCGVMKRASRFGGDNMPGAG